MDILDWIVHSDAHLADFFLNYGAWAYGILFFVIFAETGLVIFPFLPGDSLLFAAGALAVSSGLSLEALLILVPLAAILGNTANYWIGWWLGKKTLHAHKSKLINPKHLAQAHGFFAKYGAWAVTLCRFFPILRTITPFVAGLGRMSFFKFTLFNVLGGLAWGVSFILLGFYFGNLPLIKDNFHVMVIAILVMSLIPFAVALVKSGLKKKPAKEESHG